MGGGGEEVRWKTVRTYGKILATPLFLWLYNLPPHQARPEGLTRWQLNKDDNVYDVENLSAFMASMKIAEPSSRLKKSKRIAAKMAGKSTKTQPPPSSSI